MSTKGPVLGAGTTVQACLVDPLLASTSVSLPPARMQSRWSAAVAGDMGTKLSSLLRAPLLADDVIGLARRAGEGRCGDAQSMPAGSYTRQNIPAGGCASM